MNLIFQHEEDDFEETTTTFRNPKVFPRTISPEPCSSETLEKSFFKQGATDVGKIVSLCS